MKKSAFDDFAEGLMEAAYENYTQCQRSDGTIYGTKGKCQQKGAKEVSAKKGGEGGGGLSKLSTSKQADGAAVAPGSARNAYLKDLDSLGTHALRDRMTQTVKGSVQGRSASASSAPLPTQGASKQKYQMIVTESMDRINKIRKGEGKKPMTLTSVIDAVDLEAIGIDANKANTLAKAGKSTKGAIKAGKKEDVYKG